MSARRRTVPAGLDPARWSLQRRSPTVEHYCGWPERCTEPAEWHQPQPGSRHVWTAHTLAFPAVSGDPANYTACCPVAGHWPPHVCTRRPASSS
jgi:hypothetical protein